MDSSQWPKAWGRRPRRRVTPYWWPPSLFLRQAGSALYVGALTHWQALGYWVRTYGLQCLPGAAGSRGMGCIGFPAHPVWEMTAACNLRCIHCHASGGKPAPDELTTREAKQLLDSLAAVREFRMMAFTGGEPLVREDLFELLAYAQALGFTNTMATNATLIDDEVARRLRRYGLVIAAVSLDGFDAATHDYVRGRPGSFAAAIAGMRALRRAGILLHINITAMEYNMAQLEPLMALIEELGTGILLMYQLVPVGRGRRIGQAALDLGGTAHHTRHYGAGGRPAVLALPAAARRHPRGAASVAGRAGLSRLRGRARLCVHQAHRRGVALPVRRGELRQRARYALCRGLGRLPGLHEPAPARDTPPRPLRRLPLSPPLRRLPRPRLGHQRRLFGRRPVVLHTHGGGSEHEGREEARSTRRGGRAFRES